MCGPAGHSTPRPAQEEEHQGSRVIQNMDIVVSMMLVGGLALVLGFCLGYAVRAYISARRRQRWRYRHEQLPVHQAPLLAPDDTRLRDEQTKSVG